MSIRAAKNSEIVPALKLAFAEYGPEETQLRLAQSLVELERNPRLFEGMLVATDGDAITGTIWVVRMPGNSCVTGLPQVAPDADSTTLNDLLDAANRWYEQHRIALNQFVLSPDQAAQWSKLLTRHQHDNIFEMDHLHCQWTPREDGTEGEAAEAFDFAGDSTESETTQEIPAFTTIQMEDMQRVAETIEETFHDSLDCPEINGYQTREEMLEGYQATGDSNCDYWYVMKNRDEIQACLLLGARSNEQVMEIVYVGVRPTARGKGIGRAALAFAKQSARRAGLQGLIAAVDRRNEPALHLYRTEGFERVDTRIACVRLLAR